MTRHLRKLSRLNNGGKFHLVFMTSHNDRFFPITLDAAVKRYLHLLRSEKNTLRGFPMSYESFRVNTIRNLTIRPSI